MLGEFSQITPKPQLRGFCWSRVFPRKKKHQSLGTSDPSGGFKSRFHLPRSIHRVCIPHTLTSQRNLQRFIKIRSSSEDPPNATGPPRNMALLWETNGFCCPWFLACKEGHIVHPLCGKGSASSRCKTSTEAQHSLGRGYLVAFCGGKLLDWLENGFLHQVY